MPEHFLCKIIFFKETWSECFWERGLWKKPGAKASLQKGRQRWYPNALPAKSLTDLCWGCISLSHLGMAMECNYCCYVLTPMWIAHLPLACSLQGYHGVICDNLAGSDWGMAQAGNRAGKTQPCMQMGENELEWVSVTSGNMNVLNSPFIFFVWAQQIYGVMQVGNELDWMSVTWMWSTLPALIVCSLMDEPEFEVLGLSLISFFRIFLGPLRLWSHSQNSS